MIVDVFIIVYFVVGRFLVVFVFTFATSANAIVASPTSTFEIFV